MPVDSKKPFRILLAEDNRGDILLLKRSLDQSSHPHDMRVVDKSPELFEAIIDSESNLAWPDVILMDINMPVVNGFQALKTLRQFPQMKNVPVFMFTSSRAPQDAKEAKKFGANGFIVKGSTFTLEDLMNITIATGLDNGLWLSLGVSEG